MAYGCAARRAGADRARAPPAVLQDSIWGDELSTNFVVHGFGIGNVISIIKGDQEGTPPLFFLLVWLTKGVGGAEGLRIVPLAPGSRPSR